jgi:hypothetical protein
VTNISQICVVVAFMNDEIPLIWEIKAILAHRLTKDKRRRYLAHYSGSKGASRYTWLGPHILALYQCGAVLRELYEEKNGLSRPRGDDYDADAEDTAPESVIR